MTLESIAYSLIATEGPASPVKSTHHEEKESVGDSKSQKATEGTMKQSTKTKSVKPLLEAVDGLTGSWVRMSRGCMVRDCTNKPVSSGTTMLVSVYDTKGTLREI